MDSSNEDVCRRHFCRDKADDRTRVLPSQLSKSELEELYFSLLESNVDLKKTVNSQAEKLKVLNTKLNRATSAQKRHLCRAPSKCCTNAHFVIDEQNNLIDDMHQGQSRLIEKNRRLNMKLCTRKQFTKTSSSRSRNKNRPLPVRTRSGNYGDEDKTIVENTINVNEHVKNNDDDGFKNEILELKQKIRDLQEELTVSRTEYTVRIQALEAETARVQAEARGRLQEHTQQRQHLNTELRLARSSTSSLATELAIEKKKVTELHAQVRAATLAQEVVKMLEDHLTNISKRNDSGTPPLREPENIYCEETTPTRDNQDDLTEPTENKCLLDIIEKLMKKISNLQSELDVLKVAQISREGYTPVITHKHNGMAVTNTSPQVKNDTAACSSAGVQAGALGASRASIDAGASSGFPATTNYCDSTDEYPHSPRRPSNSIMISSWTLPAEEIRSKQTDRQSDRHRDSQSYKEVVEARPGDVIRKFLGDDTNLNTQNEDLPTTERGSEFESHLIKEQPSTNANNMANFISPSENKSHGEDENHAQRKPKLLKKNSDLQNLRPDCECMPTSDGKCPAAAHSKQLSVTSNSEESSALPTERNSKGEQPNQRKPSKLLKKRSDPRKLVPDCECIPTSDGKCPAGALSQSPPATSSRVNETSPGERNGPDETPGGKKAPKVLKKRSDPRNLVPDCECIPTSDGKCPANALSQPPPAIGNAPNKMSYVGSQDESPGRLSRSYIRQYQSRMLCLCDGSDSLKTVSLSKNKLKSFVCKPNSKPRVRKLSQSFTCMALETISGFVQRKDSTSSMTSNKTYTVSGEVQKSSSTNNTQRDADSIPDKSERDAGYSANGADILDESDRTNTEPTSYIETADTSQSQVCSDGEVPSYSQRRNQNDMKGTRLSTDTALNETNANEQPNTQSTSYKVEEALKAISHELCKCRELLMTQKQPQEHLLLNCIREQAQADNTLMLKKSVATPKIPETLEHLCSFTLHVGTIILSDEAVVSTRSKELYDQNYTITPIDSGRVVRFNFSTQYVVCVTSLFLDYLTHAQMVVLISEIGKQMKPYAHCAFPLREVLANPNRRVDISSALLSGAPPPPLLDDAGSAGSVAGNAGGVREVGVLDLWCMLHYDEQSSHLFETALAKTPKQDSVTNMHREKVNAITLMEKIYEEHDQFDQDSGSSKLRMISCDRPQMKIIPTDVDSVKSDLKRTRFHDPESHSLLSVANQENWNKVFPQMSSAFGSNAIAPSSPSKSSSSQATTSSYLCLNRSDSGKKMVTIAQSASLISKATRQSAMSSANEATAVNAAELAGLDSLDVTVLWLALNEQCPAMLDSSVVQLYVAYSFLGRSGADLETPTSEPKPSHYAEKVHFNFRKRFYLESCEKRALAHMAHCCSSLEEPSPRPPPADDAVVFSVISEPAQDPIGIENCEEIGRAYLYLGDLLTYCTGNSYTEVVAVYPISPDTPTPEPTPTLQDVTASFSECGAGVVEGGLVACGVLAVRVDGLDLVRQCVRREGASQPET